MNRRHTTPGSDGIPTSGRTGLRPRIRLATILLLSLAFLLGPALRAQGQQPRPIIIDVAQPPTQPLQYRFPSNRVQAETPLEFRGDGQDWSYIQFDNLPDNTSLRVRGQLAEYKDSESIQAQKWYWFKSRLPLILEIKESALTPVNIYFWFGTLNNERDKDAAKQMKAEEMRAFTDSHEIKPISQKLALAFSWEATDTTGPTSANTLVKPLTPLPTPPPPEPGWWEYFTETQPELGIIVLFLSVGLVAFVGIYVIPNIVWRIQHGSLGLKGKMQAPPTPKAKPAVVKAKPATGADLYASLGLAATGATDQSSILPTATIDDLGSISPAQVTENATLDEGTWPGQTQPTQENPNRRYGPGDVALPPSKSVSQAAAPVVGQDGNKLGGLESRLVQLENQLGRKVDHDEKLTSAVQAQINSMLIQSENSVLAQTERMLRQSVSSAVKPLEDFVSEQAASFEKKLNEAVSGIARLDAEGKGVKEQLAKLVAEVEMLEQQVLHQLHTPYDDQKQVREEIERLKKKDDEYAEQLVILLETEVRELRKRLAATEEQQAQLDKTQQARADEMKSAYADAAKDVRAEINQVRAEMKELLASSTQAQVPDSFYVKMLGEVLGQNIEELRAGNFERLSRQVGERINRFFETEVSRGDALRELRERAEAVNAALKEVVAQMQRANARAAEEAVPYLKHTEALAGELAALQTQLQSRRLNIETTLRVPVSIHANARKSFLEELSRGIRREIDKLSEPDNYFSGELKRLIMTDLIAVVDICDKRIAHPGANSELEASLKRLFAESGLRPIMPRQGEPFKAAEHDMIEKVMGGTGRSLSIAQVVTRGFYYKHGENETLLRKAGVTVYR
ncbi:MAG TPA: hypothetical protein VF544_24110 [Pyrinomonadaceae bacterium]|jgi:uncharacterized protein YbjQ (UPF0145 family)